ncbi:MAG: serpin family protein [Cyclobacteriaceae bacterium]|nr:serpin family protein [Cyclobacteriaceae bacterium]
MGIPILLSCEQDSPDPDNMLKLRPLTYEEETLLNSSNEFSFELLRMLNTKNPGRNTIFSSFGVGNGIGMAFNIMENRPREELKNFLKISQVRDIDIHKAYFELGEILNLIDLDVQFIRVNSLWINHDQEINPVSGDKIMAYYDADVEYLDFRNEKNIKTVNRWVEDRSYGKIHHVLDHMQPDDRSYIINAIHFDVQWNLPFNELSLENFVFTDLEGAQRPIKNMNLYSGEYGFYSDGNLVLLDMPLGSKQFYLSIIIPERISDFQKVLENLNPELFLKYLDQTETVKNDVLLPKINIDSEVRLKDLFPEFGLTGPIGVIENFYPTRNLFISDFIHKTSINIGSNNNPAKEGSNAGIMQYTSSSPLIIDRPFIFLVREKYTGAIVFTGKLVSPVP